MAVELRAALIAQVKERRKQHADNLAGWREPDGYLVPTEPDPEERLIVRRQLQAAIHELDHVEALVARVPEGEIAIEQMRAYAAEREREMPFVEGWQPIATAPIEGKFLVCDVNNRMMVADGHMYSLSLMPEVPKHLSGHHWTYWMRCPAPPRETGGR